MYVSQQKMQGDGAGLEWQVNVVIVQGSLLFHNADWFHHSIARVGTNQSHENTEQACLPGEWQSCRRRAHFQHHFSCFRHQQPAVTAAGCLEGIHQHCQLLPAQSTCNHLNFTHLLKKKRFDHAAWLDQRKSHTGSKASAGVQKTAAQEMQNSFIVSNKELSTQGRPQTRALHYLVQQ